MMDYSISTLAMITFFICFFILAVFGGGTVLIMIEWIAALVAAIALLLHK